MNREQLDSLMEEKTEKALRLQALISEVKSPLKSGIFLNEMQKQPDIKKISLKNLAAKASTAKAKEPVAESIDRIEENKGLKEIKAKLHKKLISAINVTSSVSINSDDEHTRKEVRRIISELINTTEFPLTSDEIKYLNESLFNDIFGLGPIEELIRNTEISDILVNGFNCIFVERNGILEKSNLKFDDEAHLLKVIKRIASSVGRRIDENSPMVDARLKDGSRVNAIIPPLALDGSALSIRKFKHGKLSLSQLVKFGALTEEMADFLRACVKSNLNVLVSGGTGAGKTTFLNALTENVHESERIVTIEDSAELQLPVAHIVRLETRPANIEGEGEIETKDLLKNALRMRPDRIIVGEIRGEEAVDLLQAMNTGHEGSMGTLHSNSAMDSLKRMETMCLMGNLNWPVHVIREQISTAVHVVVHLDRLHDGSRKVTEIVSIEGLDEKGFYIYKRIFEFIKERIDDKGKIIGHHQATGDVSAYQEQIDFYREEKR